MSYTAKNKVEYSDDMKTIERVPQNIKGAFYIPNTVTHIKSMSFFECSEIRDITIPDSVISIGLGAFSGCDSLRSIAIPASVKIIHASALSRCTGLKSVILSEGLLSIGRGCFYGCENLKALYIPKSVQEIGEGIAERLAVILFFIAKERRQVLDGTQSGIKLTHGLDPQEL